MKTICLSTQNGLTIGATARWPMWPPIPTFENAIRRWPTPPGKPPTCRSAIWVRWAGNLCNAAPSADNAPTLMALGAEVTLAGPAGERRLPLDQFFKGPGQTALAPGEIMTSISGPSPPPFSGIVLSACLGPRQGGYLGRLRGRHGGCFEGETCREVRIVLGAVAPIPLRAVKTEDLLQRQSLDAGTDRPGRRPGRRRKPDPFRCPGQRRLSPKDGACFDPTGPGGSPETGRETIAPAERNTMKQFNLIGKEVPRNDAEAKARGSALYTDDLKLPGMLHGRILRSPLAPCADQTYRRQQGRGPAGGQVRPHRGRHAQDQIRQLAAFSGDPG